MQNPPRIRKVVIWVKKIKKTLEKAFILLYYYKRIAGVVQW